MENQQIAPSFKEIMKMADEYVKTISENQNILLSARVDISNAFIEGFYKACEVCNIQEPNN